MADVVEKDHPKIFCTPTHLQIAGPARPILSLLKSKGNIVNSTVISEILKAGKAELLSPLRSSSCPTSSQKGDEYSSFFCADGKDPCLSSSKAAVSGGRQIQPLENLRQFHLHLQPLHQIRIRGRTKSTAFRRPDSFPFPNFTDRIFGEECKTAEVYEARTKDIVAATVRGFNGEESVCDCTVFAYGQTNSGKTHTMRGSATEPGVIPLAVHDLFQIIQEDVDREFLLRMSYMEIYNEDINDLLAPEHRKLQIHESIEIIESRDRTEDGDAGNCCDAVRVSVLNLVDLAGSERAAKTGAEGLRLREGSHINKSLMTLGTVIKKLSEGAESQGGHVPYRDSKLTRILQSALGGNSNTAIICNITLAQILTDAALLKRQKKEIEELRAKLMDSHSEHFEEEILNLRNTLLQSELERERMALELLEGKRAQAERDRRLKEQAKKIENLSSMNKRRDTWCPGILSGNILGEVATHIALKPTIEEPVRADRDMGLPVPFEELVHENEVQHDNDSCLSTNCGNDVSMEICTLPDANALLHVTNRRKVRKRSSHMQIKNLEMERSSIQVNLDSVVEFATEQSTSAREKYDELHEELTDAREEARVACEKLNSLPSIDILAELKLDSLNKLSMETEGIIFEVQHSRNTVDRVKKCKFHKLERPICKSPEKRIRVYLLNGIHMIFIICEQDLKLLSSQNATQLKSIISDPERIQNCMRENILELEKEKSKLYNQSLGQLKQIDDLKFDLQNSEKELQQQRELEKDDFLSQIRSLQKEISHLSSSSLVKEKETLRKELEKAKQKLKDTDFKLKNAIQDKTKLESEKAYAEREVKHLHGQRTLLERDICKRDSLADKRRDSIADWRRESKDLSKAKAHNDLAEQALQLKELELERANFDLEILSGEYQKLEVHALEMEGKIAALEEDLLTANGEKEEAFVRNEALASELESISSELSTTNSQMKKLQEEVDSIRMKMGDLPISEALCHELQSSISSLSKEKEEIAMKLTDALLELEEERAIWSAKEKAYLVSVADQAKLFRDDIDSVSRDLLEKLYIDFVVEPSEKGLTPSSMQNILASSWQSMSKEVKCELETYRAECMVLKEKLMFTEENVEQERKCSMIASDCFSLLVPFITGLANLLLLTSRLHFSSMEKSSEIDRLKNVLKNAELQCVKSQEEAVSNSIQTAKRRMMLRMTQAKLDSLRSRYKDLVDELNLCHRNYKKASAELKERLAGQGTEILCLKKLIEGLFGSHKGNGTFNS
ncbi:hypothetical protein ACLOJK_002654 [Asimina triloba]